MVDVLNYVEKTEKKVGLSSPDVKTPHMAVHVLPKFTAPEHPSLKHLRSLESAIENGPEKEPPPYTARDPHLKPDFTSESLSHPTSQVLYLPPLISKLPHNHAYEASLPAPDVPPLVTETRLPNIDPVSLSLHKALHYFRPYHDQYASTPYATAFNWTSLRLPVEEEREWYCVAFRSKRKAGSDGTPLYEADKRAHEEAVENGGLLMYWYGVPDPETGLNLATCIWQSRQHAIAANSRPHHIQAMKLARDSYEIYTLERHVLRKSAGQTHVAVESYEGGEVGW